MNRKRKYQFSLADGHGSPVAKAAHLRGGAGKHADSRTHRVRTRGDARRAAIQDAA